MNRRDIQLINEAAQGNKHYLCMYIDVHKYTQTNGTVAEILYGTAPLSVQDSEYMEMTAVTIFNNKKAIRTRTSKFITGTLMEILYYKQKVSGKAWINYVKSKVDSSCKLWGHKPWVKQHVMDIVNTVMGPYVDVPGNIFYKAGNERLAYSIEMNLVGVVKDLDYHKAQQEVEQHLGDEDILGIKDIFNEL
ncbi:MAG: hypothetical protein EBU90_20420 [Proteobacteria bacterium]|nr:hypothetical protein [Pseudomonadota bacterium]